MARNLGDTRAEKNDKIMEKKINTSVVNLCTKLPKEILKYMTYCRELKFEQKPDYAYLKKLFQVCFQNCCMHGPLEFDWDNMKIDMNKRLDTSLNGSNNADCEDAHINNNVKKEEHIPIPATQIENAEKNILKEREITRKFSRKFDLQQLTESLTPRGQKKEVKRLDKSIFQNQPQDSGLTKDTIVEESKEIVKVESKKENKKESDGSCDFNMEEIVENSGLFGNLCFKV